MKNHLIELVTAGKNMQRMYDGIVGSATSTFDLNRMETDVLLFLYNNPGFDKASDLVNMRSLTKSNVSRAIETLSQKGYINGIQDDKDRRIIHLTLMDAALPAAEAARSAQVEFFHCLYKGISEEDQEKVDHVFQKMAENIESW